MEFKNQDIRIMVSTYPKPRPNQGVQAVADRNSHSWCDHQWEQGTHSQTIACWEVRRRLGVSGR